MSPTTQLFNPNADSMLLRRIVKLNIRGVLGVGSVTCLFFAVRYLPIADAIIFTFLTPVLITIFGSAHAISSSAAKVQFHDVLMSMSHAYGPFLLATSTQATWKPGGL